MTFARTAPTASRLLVVGSLVSLIACGGGKTPTLNTTVVDPWGQPVAGINVVEGETSAASDDKGLASMPLEAKTYSLTASGDGYLPGSAEVVVDKTDASVDASITVIPVPSPAGYHVIGDTSYVMLGAETVSTVGNELMRHYGTTGAGPAFPSTGDLKVIFNTPLSKDELARLDLELHKLTFLEEMEMKTAEGIEEVEVDLWVSLGKVDFTKAMLGSTDDNYVLTLSGLAPGAYAFATQGLLRPSAPADFANNPAKKVHPFRIVVPTAVDEVDGGE